MKLTLLRTYYPKGTNGEIWFGNELLCYSIELPWKNNVRRISCIPEGVYEIRLRFSKRFKEHLELVNVKGRDYILIHPGNDAVKDLLGCIAPVMKLTGIGKGLLSKDALIRVLNRCKSIFKQKKKVYLEITERK